MNYKKIQLIVLLGVAVFGLSFQSARASEISQENVIDLTNYSRVKNGLNALAENSKLNEAAMAKAKDMLQNNYFAHTSPANVTPWHWFEKVKYAYRYAGENLAINFKTAEDEHEAWMESETHKKNILNPKYQEIGVAVQKGMIDNRLATITVQMFGAREDFQALPGTVQNNSLELFSRELESGPFGKLAFVEDRPPIKVSETKALGSAKATGVDRWSREEWVVAGQAVGFFTLLLVMAINPFLAAWLFFKKRKIAESEIVYPIRLVLKK